MQKVDISQSDLSIKRVNRVICTENKNHHKRFYVDRRPCDVFVYIISGSCEYGFEDGSRFTVKAGDIMYLTKGEKYSLYINDENYRFIFCDFDFTEDVPRKSDVFTPKKDSGAENIFIKLLNTYNQYNKTYFTDSLSLIYNIYSSIIATRSDYYIKKSVKSKILDAKEYIDSHYSNTELNVSTLSEIADMSDVYFRKLFKAEVGVSPLKYIINVRMKKAKHLMKHYPFLTLEECAKQSGFASLQYFSRIFHKEFGIAPSKYRNNVNKLGDL